MDAPIAKYNYNYVKLFEVVNPSCYSPQGMVEGVHDGLPGRDADPREGAGDAALHTAEVGATNQHLFAKN